MTEAENTIATAILNHAKRNYETGGWDIVYETMTEREIVQHIQRTNQGHLLEEASEENIAKCIKILGEFGKLHREVEEDIRGWGGLHD